MAVYANRSGDVGQPPDLWPSDAPFAHSTTRPTLVVALHPGCACSKATLGQLERLTGSHARALDVVALTAVYPEMPADQDVLNATLARIPGVQRVADPRAAIAGRFGALTSGHALLYDAAGRLQFSGGLTRARGHAGDSAGLDFVRGWLDHQRPRARAAAPVFGCALGHLTAGAS